MNAHSTNRTAIRFGSADPQVHLAVDQAVTWLRQYAQPEANLHSDSRAVAPGDIFFAYAVKGANNLPHRLDAIKRGAVAILYQPEAGVMTLEAGGDVPQLPVPALDQLAGPIAAGWYGEPSAQLRVQGVTGTNGKTSITHWLAHALSGQGEPCALIGTLGSGMPGALSYTGFTTPDAPQLQRSLATLRAAGAKHVAMEVSSHGLAQGRVNGIAFEVAIFTNLSQDHLDYHETFAAYEAAKARLFDWPSLRHAVINRDDAAGRRLLERVKQSKRGVTRIAYGIGAPSEQFDSDKQLTASAIRATANGTAFHIDGDWGSAEVEVATLGDFNVSNLLAVLGGLLAVDVPFEAALARLAKLQPVLGRMQRIEGRASLAEPLVVIDYAHTPDALEKTLSALRPTAAQRGGQLICVFGCGGDRDATKRPLMGAIAERLADQVVVTSDNPRSEIPAAIIEQIAAGMRSPEQARRVEDRAIAILQTVRGAAPEDVIVLAGKGHEATQEIAGKKRPFSDQDHALLALAARAQQCAAKGDGA
jgi:UDP-N-acetylmuramoyl-L-alanyl-D-glutamate--2,6-diaminopimelate ligase